jgi:competence protein CoiA
MKFALIDNNRVEAKPKQQGFCPNCSKPVIAKCGDKKVWHWAHRSIKSCDNWWEPETEWHRNWKNNYPAEWQEIGLLDEHTGEKHIADVKTPHNLVIEFQHSAIKHEERISREKFYKNMVWVVDGTRLKKDYPRFCKGKDSLFFTSTKQKDVYQVQFCEEVFPTNWLKSSVPVVFDFLGLSVNESDVIKNALWCLVPSKADKAFVVKIKREDFINITLNFPTLFQPKTVQPKEKPQAVTRRQVRTHYYDPKKGRFIKNWRF